ncbi:hypothetical protein COBRASIX_77 [Enterobacter phage vB_EclS_CobraSix]|uniref:Uncharacterized protein n=1 Tax=Enterobacter phage vB_EclS_CobraSix TaxID=2894794 RepID=A0AAE9CAV8_9CAUD|nr:hypothetical protein PQD12_gp81 [Enterobacter phage vB_EclS_CobraSix]UGO47240.1 hypothetical protein COBRASIX_77 [Enterobacter phage vB_EclS_CobraSix]
MTTSKADCVHLLGSYVAFHTSGSGVLCGSRGKAVRHVSYVASGIDCLRPGIKNLATSQEDEGKAMSALWPKGPR